MRIIKVILLIVFLIFNLAFNVFQKKDLILDKTGLSIGVVNLPENLVYLSDNNYVSNVMLGNLFEGLVNLTPDGDISSGLAERYTISSDGLEYRFYIRNDAYMSTGKQITSQDFLNFFKDILDKDKDKFYYDELKFIVGVDEYYKGEILFEHVGIESLKDNVLVIKLKQMDELFLKNLTKDKFSLRENFKYLYNYKDFYEYISYSGAYKISSVKNDHNGNLKIVLSPNEYYYLNNYKTSDGKLYSISRDKDVVIEAFPTREFALESYKSGKLNFVLDTAYNSISDYFDSDQIYYVHNEDSKMIFDLDKYISDESIAEVSKNIEDEQKDEDGNVIKNEEEKIEKGNFLNFIVDVKDIRHINGINGDSLNKYKFNVEYLRKELEKYNFEEKTTLKIVTYSDDNYIELARSLKNFLYEEFNLSSNVIAFDDEYIKNNLTEDSYDILISKEDIVSDVKSINFDKPNLILSNITLSDNIDGNGTIVINNIT
ncbi:hypothetical protein SFBM_1074 [Candidatus Arthromitus sp. SFB-mouse-Japan]|uniref:ABC transporter substrate-binding protein n=1 Tax=Candidatus Arthromitus sp. SFB-mouse TaxID=49118 RepID=UPI00021B7F83|nr:ABC transporter substrate-binding protein [Candidatus Arthromitus sp. SFB-mouse]EIA23420.1 Putative peptide ABC transporter periplasmic protein [Candidatus Arthromitus sp. SFB-1]EIA26839.1 Putative peptide ABC transporter periplasmic protein [Candidatus Arthromitus sp. SFB-5]EIA29864.1 Putative peptide ABC transporter periplasmic protein [Candidatus Arthromitus sp. SFB-mouse-SU]EGX28473.1 ABC transporter, substrate-binding protein [Candidatus Arthromitus sp. SFB-mouse-NYU]BAK56838.1 hypothe